MFGRVLNTTLYVVTHIVAIFPFVKPFKCQPHKMVKHIQTIRWLLPTNCLSVFNHFERLALKGLNTFHYSAVIITEYWKTLK